MSRQKIKVGFCIAYDWYLLEHALPLIYHASDVICLSIDKERISWSGKPFDFDEKKFRSLIEKIDKEKKILLLEENFHLPDLTPMQNEVRQRNIMADFLGKGGWHIQLDADEYFIDFPGFVKDLHNYRGSKKVNICVPWITLFKELDDSWLIISTQNGQKAEYVPVASLDPVYEYGRKNGYFNYKVNTPLLHQSWARSRQEIEAKVTNWGHQGDFDSKKFIQFWEELNKETYHSFQNFHPLVPSIWTSLELIPGNTINDMILHMQQKPPQFVSAKELKKQNSIFRSRLKALLARFRFAK